MGNSSLHTALHLPRATVLVIDDAQTMLDAIREQLWQFGVKVRLAHDGEEGLQIARTQQPDLILLDVMMPGIDGFETCKRLKDDPATREIPVIFMSALMEVESKLHGFEVGGVDYLTKPFNINELAARIAAHLALREARRELQAEIDTHRRTSEQLRLRSEELANTVEKLLDSERRAAQEKLAAAGELSAGVAHEIANPAHAAFLAAEDLSADLLRFGEYLHRLAGDDAPPEVLAAIDARLERLSEGAGIIVDSAARVRTIANDLLLFARMDTSSTRCSLGSLIRSTVNLVRAQYKHEAKIDVVVEDDPELDCRPSRLSQVFMNLLVNACQSIRSKARSVSGFVGTVGVQMHSDGDRLWIRIQDDGVGISADLRERVFDLFFTTKPAGEGTGLGLSISAGIIAEHGGRLDLEPSDVGACFRIGLPLQSSSAG